MVGQKIPYDWHWMLHGKISMIFDDYYFLQKKAQNGQAHSNLFKETQVIQNRTNFLNFFFLSFHTDEFFFKVSKNQAELVLIKKKCFF